MNAEDLGLLESTLDVGLKSCGCHDPEKLRRQKRLAAIANAQASQSLTGAVRSGYSTQSTLCNYLAQAAVER